MRARIARPLFVAFTLLGLQPALAARPELRGRADGTFRIVMFSDTQDDEQTDPRTTALMGRVLDAEKPDLVVIAGDCIAGGDCDTAEEVARAIAQVAEPMEVRGLPWVVAFGNHDQEHFSKTKLDKGAAIELYRHHPHNLNVRGDRGIHGVGNDVLLVRDHTGKDPVFAVWLLDSGEYALGGYDWIHRDQVEWYVRTSQEMERRSGHKLPGIMCFHIPLREFGELAQSGKFTGDRNEGEGASSVNSGLFAAVLERGDVTGIFCGHDHENNYVGAWHGVRLGYDASVGYASYNLPDDDPRSAHTRGGRVFLIKESDPSHWQTWMRFVDGSSGPVQ